MRVENQDRDDHPQVLAIPIINTFLGVPKAQNLYGLEDGSGMEYFLHANRKTANGTNQDALHTHRRLPQMRSSRGKDDDGHV